jgi:hypothetical protein
MAYHLSREARQGVNEFHIPKVFDGELLEFQARAVQIAANHLNKRHGVLIGDVVGLGKTRIGAALARMFEDEFGIETLIISPKNLVPMWENYRERYGLRGRVTSLKHSCVYLICIDRMLETMLIVDARAVSEVIGIPLGRPRPSHKRSPQTEANPKHYLSKWFQRYHKGTYADHVHAKRIAERIDVGRLQSACPEYGRFAQSLTQKPCRPPPAWRP